MSESKRKVELQIAGNDYVVNLDEPMADFIISDLERLGFQTGSDNKVEILLKAYLQQVKERIETQNELEDMLGTFKED